MLLRPRPSSRWGPSAVVLCQRKVQQTSKQMCALTITGCGVGLGGSRVGGGCQARFDGHNFTGTVQSASEAAGVLGGKRSRGTRETDEQGSGTDFLIFFFRCSCLLFAATACPSSSMRVPRDTETQTDARNLFGAAAHGPGDAGTGTLLRAAFCSHCSASCDHELVEAGD